MMKLEKKITRKDLKNILGPGKNWEEVLDAFEEDFDYNDLVYLMMQRNN